MSIVQFPRDVASSVLKVVKWTGSWATIRKQERRRESLVQENRAKSEVVRPLPELSHLKTMLDAAYVASMMEEEGRRVAFTLAYLSERGARELGHHVFRFQAPLPLKPNHLAKYGVTVRMLRARINGGHLPAVRIGRAYVVAPADVAAMLTPKLLATPMPKRTRKTERERIERQLRQAG